MKTSIFLDVTFVQNILLTTTTDLPLDYSRVITLSHLMWQGLHLPRLELECQVLGGWVSGVKLLNRE